MTESTLKYAKEKGFKEKIDVDSTFGMRRFLIKSNVSILVEAYSNGEGKYDKPDKEIINDVDRYEELKILEDFIEKSHKEWEEKLRKEMLADD